MGKQPEAKQAEAKQVEAPNIMPKQATVVPTEEDMKAIRAVELPWIPPPPEASGGAKLLSKIKENPFVPLGESVSSNMFGKGSS